MPTVAPIRQDWDTVMQSPNSRHCAAVELGSSVWTTNRAPSQRKNAANKLQHSGLATVVVYHNRHRVLHHIDSAEHAIRLPRFDAFKERKRPDTPVLPMGLILLIACAHRLVAAGARWRSLTGAEITLS